MSKLATLAGIRQSRDRRQRFHAKSPPEGRCLLPDHLEGVDLACDSSNTHLQFCVEMMRIAYEEDFGTPIPLAAAGE